ncbi:hypothetical protein [Francisella philomiragia]|uniref:hypothetical protein n=1 Tax=Francisella philomiragia TaxID=28110 RepID=UPI001B8AA0E7|nr:hypothetical protein [Francisella philomiragia]QUE31833.1 hypothetical protein IMS64_02175 [Francisella philomiragia]
MYLDSLYPQFERFFNNQLSSKDIGFNLQISTIDLHLADNVSYKDFIKSLKEKLQKTLEVEKS